MALSINATVGSASANSFVTEAEMDTYAEGRLNATAWTSDAAALPALVEATRDISDLLFIGTRVDATQALSWPRAYAINPDAPVDPESPLLEEYVYFAENVVPQRVKDATCELALEYLKAGTRDLAVADASEGVKRTKVDVIEKEFFAGAKPTRGPMRFPRVAARLAPLLATGAGGLAIVRA